MVIINLTYLVASILFIFGIKGLTHPRTAVRGNLLGATGMFLAVVATLADKQRIFFKKVIRAFQNVFLNSIIDYW